MTETDFLTSVYFYFVTFTTIGYGDYNLNVILDEPRWCAIVSPMFWLGMTAISSVLQSLVDFFYNFQMETEGDDAKEAPISEHNWQDVTVMY